MNASVDIQDQLKTITISALISCIASICHVYIRIDRVAENVSRPPLIVTNII
jgi:hypothetical protein